MSAEALHQQSAYAAAEPRPRSESQWQVVTRSLLRNRVGMASLLLLLVLVLIAAVAPGLLPYSYAKQDLLHIFEPPSALHILGTDQLGRDVLTRLIYGARISLTVGFVAEAIILSVGILIGAITGYIGGKFDGVVMRFVDAMYAFPDLLLIIIVISFIKAELASPDPAPWLLPLAGINLATGGLLGVFIALGLTSWLTTARLVRGQFLSLRERPYVEAARCIGASPLRIVRLHLLPNTLAPILVAATLGVPNAILLEASLSFIGLGVDPPTPSWGIMISEGVNAVESYPHLILSPVIAVSLTLLSLNFLGDALRDALDPLLKQA
jgi:ABC-type dipeptide/oligopeptide/nickel transport system permease subunit